MLGIYCFNMGLCKRSILSIQDYFWSDNLNNINLVSVIIPTHNRIDLLKRAIYSALNQTYKNIEIIVVDDQSIDGTNDYVSTIQDKKIKYIRNEKHLHVSQSRNIGINHARGEFIAFLDDDDEWLPKKLEKQLPLFNNIRVGIVYSSITLHFERYNLSYITKPAKRGDVYKSLLIKNIIGGTVSVIVRKKALEEIAEAYYFDLKFPAREEYDLWIRLSKEWEVEYIKEPLVTAYYRNSITRISTNVDNYVKAINLLNIKQLSTDQQRKSLTRLSQQIKVIITKLCFKC